MKRLARLWRSLLTKYMAIVLLAILLVPILLPVVAVLVTLQYKNELKTLEDRWEGKQYETWWHEQAAGLSGANDHEVEAKLRELKAEMPKAGMFWVDGTGRLRLTLDVVGGELPEQWSMAETVAFMKKRYGGDPFTIVAFIGQEQSQGILVFELNRAELAPAAEINGTKYAVLGIGGAVLVLLLFLFVSMLFFIRIRRRLVRLEHSMGQLGPSGLPSPVEISKEDEIGRLEASFNRMVAELEESRDNTQREEALRRDLIAKLSHDLRTPLTAIRGHAFGLQEEQLSERGRQSVQLIERKIDYVGKLIDDLFSYSLLAAGKYPCAPKPTDIVRLTRTLLANWYPVFEQEGFEVEAYFPDAPIRWDIDAHRLERALDNYFQNVLRHAGAGRYVSCGISEEHGGSIIIADRGPGIEAASAERGAGMGMAIASLMLADMGLKCEMDSGTEGTRIRIKREVRSF